MPGNCALGTAMPVSGAHEDSKRIARLRRLWATASFMAATSSTNALAAGIELNGRPISTVDIIQGSVMIGIVGSALFCAAYLIRERSRISKEGIELRSTVSELNAELQRSEALLNLRDQRIVIWSDPAEKAKIMGSLPLDSGAPEDRADFLAFGRWLSPRSASVLDNSTDRLRKTGQSFDIVVETHKGVPFEVQGRKAGAFPYLRFVSLSEAYRVQARLKLDNQRLSTDFETVIGLLATASMPVWLRREDGRLTWVNSAYATAVEAHSAAEAVDGGRELLGSTSREEIVRKQQANATYANPVSTVVRGDRRIFEVTDFRSEDGSAGFAVDVTDMRAIDEKNALMQRSHADTLDRLTTPVAIFDADEKLQFYNQAFQKLWDLDTPFLESAPDNTLLLDRLRSDGKLAEQPEWRRWKDGILSVYRATEPQEHSWHLPDGRTLRVVANPQPNGGVTWVFENLTEKIDLESRYNTAVRVQGETLDNLAEGVAMFGPDGRTRLFNPSFMRLWGLEPGQMSANTHIAELRRLCAGRAKNEPWDEFVQTVTGFSEERDDRNGNVELVNGTVLRYAIIHLPNGQVMMTFVDVTDSVNVERALKEKNEALQTADGIKNQFLQHVSYELRSPLTNIIGFSELMRMPGADPLTPRQKEYIAHIGSSSTILLSVVNDILDLATVDAGVMRLDIATVSVEAAIAAAAEHIAERLEENRVILEVDTAEAPATIRGDEVRVRQVLSNLLANAANFAPPNSAVRLTCRSAANGTEFIVHDDGPGMPKELVDQAFRPFESRANGGRRRGAGLGLTIVRSFVQLHGGSVSIDTGDDRGTTVTCFFPTSPPSGGSLHQAAE